MNTAKTINKSCKANSQNSNFTLFHDCIYYSFFYKLRSESETHIVINVCPLSLKKSINSLFISLFFKVLQFTWLREQLYILRVCHTG